MGRARRGIKFIQRRVSGILLILLERGFSQARGKESEYTPGPVEQQTMLVLGLLRYPQSQ